MKLHLKNPLVFFDLETTGMNVATDRTIELSFLKISPNDKQEIKTFLVNPGMPIPPEVSLIHGFYDKDVQDAPFFKNIAKELHKFLEGCDLAGYNMLKFDVPMLVEEFLRNDVDFDVSRRKLIDAQKLFFLMEKRTLSAALKFYCGKEMDNAHSAEADTLATYEVLKKQVELYENMDVEDALGNKLGTIKNDMDVLHKITLNNMVDLAGRIVYNNDGVEVFNFGKHRGKKVLDVFKQEPNYYDWMLKNDFPLDTKRKLTEIKLKSFKMN